MSAAGVEHGPSMLTDVIIYLGSAVVCVPLATRLKLGSVLGYLAAGCLIRSVGFGGGSAKHHAFC